MIDLSTVKHIHFVGIGGVSNSAIAEILFRKGYHVTGSDEHSSFFTQHLEEIGVQVYYNHQAQNIQGADLIVYTAAANKSNVELLTAEQLRIPAITRAEMLGRIMEDYKTSICVAGTHGKTTTTSMITKLINHPEIDPTALVGGYSEDLKSNLKFGHSNVFLTEACEYTDSFLSFFPQIAVVLNVDEDHLDYFKDIHAVVHSFNRFTDNIKEDGILIINADDYHAHEVQSYYNGNTITFGINENATCMASNIQYDALGCPSFDVKFNETLLGTFHLELPGVHNIYNALASICVAQLLEVPSSKMIASLATFKNAKRRFQKIGYCNGAMIIDDYAHHPTEIRATLEAASKLEGIERTRVIFQPHTYTRTKELLHDFAKSFHQADEVILCDIYASREDDIYNIHSKNLLELIIAEGIEASYLPTFEDIITYIKDTAQPNEIIFTMGAGSVTNIAPQLID